MIKHQFIKTATTWFRIMQGIGGRPELAYGNNDIRPYWKSHGTGFENLQIELQPDGSYLIRATNQAEGANSGKETWVHLPKDLAAKVGAFLQGRAS